MSTSARTNRFFYRQLGFAVVKWIVEKETGDQGNTQPSLFNFEGMIRTSNLLSPLTDHDQRWHWPFLPMVVTMWQCCCCLPLFMMVLTVLSCLFACRFTALALFVFCSVVSMLFVSTDLSTHHVQLLANSNPPLHHSCLHVFAMSTNEVRVSCAFGRGRGATSFALLPWAVHTPV